MKLIRSHSFTTFVLLSYLIFMPRPIFYQSTINILHIYIYKFFIKKLIVLFLLCFEVNAKYNNNQLNNIGKGSSIRLEVFCRLYLNILI